MEPEENRNRSKGANAMEDNQPKPEKKPTPSSHVRFTEIEYKRIQKMRQTLGLSIPDILKKNTFDRFDLESARYTKEDADRVVSELKRIGNNLNQVVHKINSGLMTGWSQSFNGFLTEIIRLRHEMGLNGVRKA
jgi:hypothetical protein